MRNRIPDIADTTVINDFLRGANGKDFTRSILQRAPSTSEHLPPLFRSLLGPHQPPHCPNLGQHHRRARLGHPRSTPKFIAPSASLPTPTCPQVSPRPPPLIPPLLTVARAPEHHRHRRPHPRRRTSSSPIQPRHPRRPRCPAPSSPHRGTRGALLASPPPCRGALEHTRPHASPHRDCRRPEVEEAAATFALGPSKS